MAQQNLPKTSADWKDAVDDAYTHLNEPGRVYGTKAALSLVDDLAVTGQATKEDLTKKHLGPGDFIETVLGHVTTAVHGKGSVPKVGGWYARQGAPIRYVVSPQFAEAWKKKRRLN